MAGTSMFPFVFASTNKRNERDTAFNPTSARKISRTSFLVVFPTSAERFPLRLQNGHSRPRTMVLVTKCILSTLCVHCSAERIMPKCALRIARSEDRGTECAARNTITGLILVEHSRSSPWEGELLPGSELNDFAIGDGKFQSHFLGEELDLGRKFSRSTGELSRCIVFRRSSFQPYT